MKKALITLAVILPFFWDSPTITQQPKPVDDISYVWKFPEKIFESFTNTSFFKDVQGWFEDLFSF